MEEKQLAIEINKWFNKVDRYKSNFWNRNVVAAELKRNLLNWGNFKGNNRGSLDKALRKMQFNRAKENGYEGEFEG